MDLPSMVRRLSFSTRGDNNNPSPLVVPPNRRMSKCLTVDTTVGGNTLRDSFEEPTMEPQWNNEQDSPTPTLSSRSATPTSTRSEDSAMYRRRRSNSECLFLAKNGGMQDLPGPCREYISSVKQILARSEESRPLARQRSMSLRNNTSPKQ